MNRRNNPFYKDLYGHNLGISNFSYHLFFDLYPYNLCLEVGTLDHNHVPFFWDQLIYHAYRNDLQVYVDRRVHLSDVKCHRDTMIALDDQDLPENHKDDRIPLLHDDAHSNSHRHSHDRNCEFD